MSIAIFLTTDLKMGGGVERWTLNTVKGRPNDQKIIIISTDYADRARFSVVQIKISQIDHEQNLI
ncbi:MAG: hypothetical protein AMDU5_GPLC00012G0011 [Thermoplasmatales archaeon Gpl]|nr:MAG: hypothetical protein AMDU5_GPLC00012G0011 [Thermoplasmatales archaeon Gpl]